MQLLTEARRGHEITGGEAPICCESFDMNAGNQIQVIFKSSKHS